MSSIDKLQILGIRSFGPEDGDVATIKFSSPLTLILGQNGCGKTTIIEALKYATCGELPGGTDSGSGFVHDPELAHLPQVRGQVKMRCTDTRGTMHTVVRTVQATRKMKKIEFKSIDTTVTTNNKSVSGRCADMDAVMCDALGVSKAVLSNVIFCHQEDSAWPLEKGKKIKERFDAIFGITEYNKCLDHLRSLVKEKIIEIGLMKERLKSKEETWKNMKSKKKQLKEKKESLQGITHEMEKIDKDMEPINDKIKELQQKELNLGNHMALVKEKQYRIQSIKDSIADLKKKVQREFVGSKEELIFEIETFEKGLSEKVTKLGELVEEKENVSSKETRLETDIRIKQRSIGTLESADKQNSERIALRNEDLKMLSDALGLPRMTNSEMNETNEEELLKSVEIKIKDCNKQLEKMQEDQDHTEKLLQNKIDGCRETKVRLEHDIKTKKKSLEDNKKEVKKVNLEIAEVDKSTKTLAELDKNLETVNEELSALTDSLNVDQCKASIKQNSDTINRLDEKLTSLNEEIKTLQKISIQKANLDNLQERKKTQEKEFNALKDKHKNSLIHLISEVPDSNFKSKLDACIKKTAIELGNINDAINNDERELSGLRQKKIAAEDLLRNKRLKLSKDTEKIAECCGSLDIDSYIAKLDTEINDVQVRKGTMSASDFLFRRYVDGLKSNPMCPLCRREFNENSEVENLIAELNQRLEKIPAGLEGVELELKTVSKRHANVLQLKPVAEEIHSLQNEDIPQLRSNVTDITAQIAAVQARIDENRQRLFGPQTDELMAKSLLSDVTLMDQYQRDIRNLIREISIEESQLPTLASAKSLKDANDEQDAVRSQLSKARKEVDDDQKKLGTYNEKMSKLSKRKNELTAQQLKIAGGVQQRKQLFEKLSDLQTLEGVLTTELQSAEAQLEPISQELEKCTQELNQKKFSHKRLRNLKKDQVVGYERKVDDIKKLQTEIVKYNKSGGAYQMVDTRKELGQMLLDKDNLATRKSQLEKEIESINQFRNTQQLQKIDLDYNLQLWNKKEELTKIQRELNDLEGNTETINAEQMHKLKQELNMNKKNLERKRSYLEGRQEELQNAIAVTERELAEPKNRNAEDEYRKQLVELTVSSKAVEDLKEYEKAMDWVMIYFHKDRMKMINTIVRELWRNIYRGNDIDYIEIKTDESSVSSTSGRRSYDYKVVQVKNCVELDMRGRCSAGQKVLACLIIRMALAETFSRNCAILTLDEPTTNLDKENIESLSEALADIVERRSVQRNFQLIVITHDEEFLKRLLRVENVGHYLQVQRNHNGKSEVVKRHWR